MYNFNREHCRVLIVDDYRPNHDDFRKVLCRDDLNLGLDQANFAPLDSHGKKSLNFRYEIVSAYQGEEACQLIRDAGASGRQFDLAFVAMRMPNGWDRVETIEQLRAIDPELHVVICGALSDAGWHDIARRLGHNANMFILRKQLDNLEVLQLTAKLMQKQRLARQAKLKQSNLDRIIEQLNDDLSNKDGALRQKHRFDPIVSMTDALVHEFNELHQVIHGVLQLVEGRIYPRLQTNQDERVAYSATNQASELPKQLFALRCQQPMALEFAAVSDIIGRLAIMIQPFCGERIVVKVGSIDPQATISVDPSLIDQALISLCINARNAMPLSGIIAIDARCVDVNEIRTANLALVESSATSGRYAAVRIFDTGCSIPIDVRNRIFDPCFIARDIGEGTGVGESTVHDIIKLHGGWIEVESEYSVGTTVVINLPLVDAPSPAPIIRSQLRGRVLRSRIRTPIASSAMSTVLVDGMLSTRTAIEGNKLGRAATPSFD